MVTNHVITIENSLFFFVRERYAIQNVPCHEVTTGIIIDHTNIFILLFFYLLWLL